MSRNDEILARQEALVGILEMARQVERDAVLEDFKENIKMFAIKTTDFKGLFKPRVTRKQVDDFRHVMPEPNQFKNLLGHASLLCNLLI